MNQADEFDEFFAPTRKARRVDKNRPKPDYIRWHFHKYGPWQWLRTDRHTTTQVKFCVICNKRKFTF